jgi:hypothetical protein
MKVTPDELTEKGELRLFVTVTPEGLFYLCDARGILLPGQLSVEILNHSGDFQRVECMLCVPEAGLLTRDTMVEGAPLGPDGGST